MISLIPCILLTSFCGRFLKIFGPFWNRFSRFSVHFGSFFGPFWRSGAALPKSFQKEAFLGAPWSPFWRQDGPSWSQDGAKMTNLAPTWSQDGQLEAQDGELDALLGSFLATFA